MLPPPLKARYADRHGGAIAEAYVFAKIAVRYKSAGLTGEEQTRQLAWKAPAGIQPGELLESVPIALEEDSLRESAPAGLAYSDLAAFIQTDGAKAIERVLKDRLDDELAIELLYDPQTKKFGQPNEDEHDFALRLGHAAGTNPKRDAIQAKIDKARSDLALKEREASGRKMEKWASVGTAILGNLGVFTGRSKRVKTTGLGSVLSKSRMEGTAAQRKETLQARIRELEAELGEVQNVNPSRFERRMLKRAKRGRLAHSLRYRLGLN